LIDSALFAEPVALDRNLHQRSRLKERIPRYERAAGVNALFVTAIEFVDVAREYPIVFVEAGKGDDGQREVAPMAVLGLTQGENLMLNGDGSWDARYVPAMLRAYPIGLARADADNFVLVIDAKADALSETEGERLFDDAGAATPVLEEARKFVQQLEEEGARTRLLCRRLLELELLQPKRFEATVPNGSNILVDGFLALDEPRLAALPADTLLDLHQSGVLACIFAHQFSLPLMRRHVERRVARGATANA
jgi:hypothetical protein